MLLLLVFVAFQLTNSETERAAVYLGRGYDVVKGNPLILRPGDGADSNQFTDPGLKPAMVLKIRSASLNAENESSVIQLCRNKSISIQSISQFHEEVLKEMFLNSEDWHDKLREFAVFGDYRTDEGKYPDDRMFLYVYEKCISEIAKNEQSTTNIEETVISEANTSPISEGLKIEGVTDDFRRTVCELPEQYAPGNAEYIQLLSTFGTSIIIGTTLGELKINRYQAIKKKITIVTPLFRNENASQTDQMYVHITKKLVNMINETNFENKNSDKISWEIGNANYLSPAELSLWNLDEAFHDFYWPNCYIFVSRPGKNPPVDHDCCSRLDTLKENVKLALLDYPEQLNIQLTNETDLVYRVMWPSGTYSLFQTGSGCPAETGFQWREGFVQHTQGSDSKVTAPPGMLQADVLQKRTKVENRYVVSVHHGSTHVHLAVNYWVFTHSFCTKVDHGTKDEESTWPAGSYCVYKFRNCPQGFKEGWVYWDDYDRFDVYRRSGIYPEGVYDINTQIYFCCRNDGPASSPIILPVQKPFVLMRIGGKCQTVKWTKVTEASIYYDGHWGTSWFPRSHFVGGLHPDNDMNYSNNKLYYCHYQKYISPK